VRIQAAGMIDTSGTDSTAARPPTLEDLAELLEPTPATQQLEPNPSPSMVNALVLIGGLLVALGAGAACVLVIGRSRAAAARTTVPALVATAPVSAATQPAREVVPPVSTVAAGTPIATPPKSSAQRRRSAITTARAATVARSTVTDPPTDPIADERPPIAEPPATTKHPTTSEARSGTLSDEWIDPFAN
jgi:hypothetical protein